MTRRFTLIGATALVLLSVTAFAQAKELVLYCSVVEEWCRAVTCGGAAPVTAICKPRKTG